MKLRDKVFLLATAAVLFGIGYEFLPNVTKAQAPAPQCNCQYPDNNGNQYGVKRPINPPVDGSMYTCEVKRCWLPVSGGGGHEGGEDTEILIQ